jgi:phosphatidylserine decarboxylase
LITRASIAGVVEGIEYIPGEFFRAYKDEADLKNESNSIFIKGDKTNLLIKQIVGFAARRIKCFVKKNERVEKGQKLGLMYFGSRVNIFLAEEVRLKIQLNQKVRGGETEIGEVKNENG